MKKAVKVLVFFIIGLIIIVIGLLSYVKLALPNVGNPPELKVKITPVRLERGKYLANHVTICMDCHSTRDWSLYTGPLDSAQFGGGGEVFGKQLGFPGEFISPNITPHNLKYWSDGEIYRAITSGVSKDGHALFPIMPYPNFAKMDTEDIYSLIAYIRSLPVKESQPKVSVADFPMNFIINTIPAAATPQKMPSPNDQVAYGGYLVNAANCNDCHTKKVDGAEVEGMKFAGGFAFNLPNGTIVTSANITPDKATGIGSWTKEQFLARFKAYSDSTYTPRKIAGDEFQTIMPWTMYAGMKTSDLEAVYAYLRTLKPVNNSVVKFARKSD